MRILPDKNLEFYIKKSTVEFRQIRAIDGCTAKFGNLRQPINLRPALWQIIQPINLPFVPGRFGTGSQIFKLLIKLFRKFSSEGI
jgi:hypothetical protein